MKKLYLCWTLLGLLFAPFIWAQNSVTGTVNDETGLPLPGATVVVDGTILQMSYYSTQMHLQTVLRHYLRQKLVGIINLDK